MPLVRVGVAARAGLCQRPRGEHRHRAQPTRGNDAAVITRKLECNLVARVAVRARVCAIEREARPSAMVEGSREFAEALDPVTTIAGVVIGIECGQCSTIEGSSMRVCVARRARIDGSPKDVRYATEAAAERIGLRAAHMATLAIRAEVGARELEAGALRVHLCVESAFRREVGALMTGRAVARCACNRRVERIPVHVRVTLCALASRAAEPARRIADALVTRIAAHLRVGAIERKRRRRVTRKVESMRRESLGSMTLDARLRRAARRHKLTAMGI